MNQILHIFRKDTQRLWPEILLTLLVTAAFAWIFPAQWTVFPYPNTRSTFAVIAVLLMIVAWWLLTARAVQGENLVGDRQFWITRPYKWPKLLAAKALFVAVWAGLPFLLAQHWLMHVAGFGVLDHAGLMLRITVTVGLVIVLPVFAMAALTSTFARLTMTLVGGLVLFTVSMFLLFGSGRGNETQNPYHNVFFYPLLGLGLTAAIVAIYWTRRVWASRGLALVVVALLTLSVAIYGRQSLVDRAYPALPAGAVAPVVMELAVTPKLPLKARSYQGTDFVDVPLHLSGVRDGEAVLEDNYRYTVTSADGKSWTSPWQMDHIRVRPGPGGGSLVSLQMKPEQYAQLRGVPLTLTIDFALSRYAAETTQSAVYPDHDGPISGLGRCMSEPNINFSLMCRAPVLQPRLTYMTVQWTREDCDASTAGAPILPGSTWVDREGGLDFSISSVWNRNLFFWNRAEDSENVYDSGRRGHWSICPGSPITVTPYHLIERTRTTMTLRGFLLPEKVTAT